MTCHRFHLVRLALCQSVPSESTRQPVESSDKSEHSQINLESKQRLIDASPHSRPLTSGRSCFRCASILCALLLFGQSCLFTGCSDKTAAPTSPPFQIAADHEPFSFDTEHDCENISFRVDWPPMAPADSQRLQSPPLLSGELIVATGRRSSEPTINVRIELVRADSESDRLRWNRHLKFPEYDWMSRVRTWDPEKKWLWPNLPYLFRAHGIERQQRYGGVDPEKGIDNDFAAVVVKSLDVDDQNEVELVTAEWHPPRGGFVDRRSIVHRAISDDLQWSIPESRQSGELGVWLIYADFLNFSPPRHMAVRA